MPNYSGKWTPSQILQARGQDLWPTNGPFFYVDDVFSTYLYDGNGSTQTITNGIDLSGEGGLVWSKWRSGYYTTRDHNLFDTERGTSNYLNTNLTNAENTSYTNVITYNSNGFTWNQQFPSNMSFGGETFVSWSFRKQAGFFDIVTYTGDGSQPRAINHNLGSVPGFIIVKRTDTTGSWQCRHRSLPNSDRIVLNSTSTAQSNAAFFFGDGTNPVAATATQFTVADDAAVNASGGTYVAYLFAHDDTRFGDNANESIIKCGSFSGTGQVDLGWEPQWLLVKPYTQTWAWEIADNMRRLDGVSSSVLKLEPNSSNAEANGSDITINATGFDNQTFGATYPCIYIAIRRPMKTPTAGTEVFKPVTRAGSGAVTTTGVGFTPDAFYNFDRTFGGSNGLFDRLRGRGILQTMFTAAENATSPAANDLVGFDTMDGVELGAAYNINMTGSGRNFVDYYFKRATGFFDVVAYTGNGTAGTTHSHNLGVVPEFMIVKSRSLSEHWPTYHVGMNGGTTPQNYNMVLSATTAEGADSDIWNNTAPTSSVFTVGGNDKVNSNTNTYIAYLFATLAGISKVGSYTGTAANLDVDCGFTAGARWIMIKRTDSAGDWYVYDSARGIIAGNDPYVLANSSAAEVTGTDYIDPLSSGFTVTSSAPAGLNASGGEYIFLAIA